MTEKKINASHGGVAIDSSGIGNRSTFNITRAARYGSVLNPLLEAIIGKYDPSSDGENGSLPDPDEKISFNDVNIYAEELRECVGFLSIVEEQIDAIDDEEPNSKAKFLRAINQNYITHKNRILIENKVDVKDREKVISLIKMNSDYLIKCVAESLLTNAEVDLHHRPIEDVNDTIKLVICYGFINCRILEKPNDY